MTLIALVTTFQTWYNKSPVGLVWIDIVAVFYCSLHSKRWVIYFFAALRAGVSLVIQSLSLILHALHRQTLRLILHSHTANVNFYCGAWRGKKSWWWSPRGVFAPTLEGSLSRFQKDFFCLTNATRAYVEFAPKCQRSLNVHFSSIHKDGVLSLGVWFEHQLQSAWDSDRMKCFHEGLWLKDMEAPVWLDFQECDVPVMKMSRITQTGGKKSIL